MVARLKMKEFLRKTLAREQFQTLRRDWVLAIDPNPFRSKANEYSILISSLDFSSAVARIGSKLSPIASALQSK